MELRFLCPRHLIHDCCGGDATCEHTDVQQNTSCTRPKNIFPGQPQVRSYGTLDHTISHMVLQYQALTKETAFAWERQDVLASSEDVHNYLEQAVKTWQRGVPAQDLYNHSLPFCRDVHFPHSQHSSLCMWGSSVELSHLKLEIFFSQGRPIKNPFFRISTPYVPNTHQTHFLSLATLLLVFWLVLKVHNYSSVKLSQVHFPTGRSLGDVVRDIITIVSYRLHSTGLPWVFLSDWKRTSARFNERLL